MDKKKIISLIAAGVMMIGITVSLGTGAWFTDNKTSNSNVFKSGTLKLGDPGTITSGMSLGNIYPGWTESKTVTINNTGSLPLKYKVSVNPLTGNILFDGQTPLQVNINNQGFVNIKALNEVFLGEIPANSKGTFDIGFMLPKEAGNEYADKTATFDFNFTAAQINDTSFTVNNVQQLVVIKNIDELNAAINSQADGQTWLIEPGTYTLTGNLKYTAPELGGFFGVITANNITVKGVGYPIINSNGNAGYTGTFIIKGNNVSVEGINFEPNIQGPNRTVDVAGTNATIKNCKFTIDGALYIPAEFNNGSLGTLNIIGNSFTNTMVCLDSAKNADSIIISNNTFNMGPSNYYAIGNVSWTTPATTTMAAVTVSNNVFNTNSTSKPIIRNRMTGTFNLTGNFIDGSTPSDWTSYLLLQNDRFITPTNPIVVVDGITYSIY